MKSKHPSLSSLPLIILTLLLALPSLPASPTHHTILGRDLECFNLTTPNAYPINVDDCPSAIELIYHDPTGVMALQQFTRNPRLAEITFHVPHAWQVGSCQVLLTSGNELAIDSFRLVDVIAKAMRVIEVCPPMSKKSLGGIVLVGHGASFFVAVNGPDESYLNRDRDGDVRVGGTKNGTRLVMLGGADNSSGVNIVHPDLTKEGSTAS